MPLTYTHSSDLARPSRRLAAVLLTAGGLALTACGGSDAPVILDTEKVERAIERSSLEQRGTAARVSCPAGVHQKQGKTFACTAMVKRADTRFTVTQLDGSGKVHYEAR